MRQSILPKYQCLRFHAFNKQTCINACKSIHAGANYLTSDIVCILGDRDMIKDNAIRLQTQRLKT